MTNHLRRYVAAGATVSALGLALCAPTANADPSPTTIVNGILSVTPACQGISRDAIIECTQAEKLTTEFPVMLDLNPIGTHIVVLGAGLFDDGSMRPVLHNRLQAAKLLAQRYPFTPIIVSGGVPKNGITEAGAMHSWLVANGIPDIRITEENTSRSTIENAKNSNAILASRGATGAVVVTSPDHLQRAMIDFRSAFGGRIPVAGVVAPYL
ncbi:YdcF family protein [Rhodococcus sp. HNM0569]|uniref:YdcF family protein n=1 Tax=Rhodococcus sp. HNM0569 TaxID=2716340 RepID=UPI00146D09CB|nr:YdcF family protein [Rhodococcus sp. HNM0569]NLU84545.1 YdcF family protein [Rhodococcus sp. HNM0569]